MGAEPDDPSKEELLRQIAELRAQLTEKDSAAANEVAVDTGGGASVRESVTAGRDFIGRDLIQIINQIVRDDSKAEEAESDKRTKGDGPIFVGK